MARRRKFCQVNANGGDVLPGANGSNLQCPHVDSKVKMVFKRRPFARNAANARERSRMRVLSKAFIRLKTCLPWVPADTKLSKLDTLRLASSYIAHLRDVLTEDTVPTSKHPSELSWPYGGTCPQSTRSPDDEEEDDNSVTMSTGSESSSYDMMNCDSNPSSRTSYPPPCQAPQPQLPFYMDVSNHCAYSHAYY